MADDQTVCGGLLKEGYEDEAKCDLCWWEDGASTKSVGWWARLLRAYAEPSGAVTTVNIHIWSPVTDISPVHCIHCGTALWATEAGEPMRKATVAGHVFSELVHAVMVDGTAYHLLSLPVEPDEELTYLQLYERLMAEINEVLHEASVLAGKAERRTSAEDKRYKWLQARIGYEFSFRQTVAEQERIEGQKAEIAALEEELFGEEGDDDD